MNASGHELSSIIKEYPASDASSRVSRALRELLEGLVKQPQIHHAIMAVERGDGSFRWAGAAGEAQVDGTPMRPDTPFFVASVTKLYIATATLKLWEAGRVALDEPILSYLPQTLIGGLHRLGGVDHTGAITVRHLLSHTTGLPDYIEESPRGGRSLFERLLDEGDMAWGLDEVVRIARDGLVPHFPPQDLVARRQRARYSDTNYQLLIGIIEAVTGQPVAEVFSEMIYRPLGLRNTFHPGDAPEGCEPAIVWAGDMPLDIPQALRSFGDLYATAAETMAFLRALVSGTLFADPATAEIMRGHWNRFPFPRDRAALRGPGWPIEYAMGMMRFSLPRFFNLGRAMPAVIGHSGSTGTWLFYCPALDLYLSGAVDQATAGAVPYRVIPRLLRIFEP